MHDPMNMNGKRVTVCGLGDTGLSLARYAAVRGAHVQVLDSRENPPKLADLQIKVPSAQFLSSGFESNAAHDADLLLMSPGVSVGVPAVVAAAKRGITIAGDIEVFAHHVPTQTHVIGITGSNGKTTTTALTGALCAAAGLATLVAGNIGATVLDALEPIERTGVWPQAVALELSSFQLESLRSLRCTRAAVLNVSEDHLDRYASYAHYCETKANLLAQTQTQVLFRDDPLVMKMLRQDRPAITFGTSPANDQHFGIADGWLMHGHARVVETSALKLNGQHNHMNVLAALALVASLFPIDKKIVNALTSFEGLPHRMVTVATHNAVHYIDDSKATNVGAVVAGLQGLGRTAVLIAGGDGKGQDFSPLRNVIELHARAVVLIGRDAALIAQALHGIAPKVLFADSMHAAVDIASSLAQPDDAVLLSPACASLDMYRSYGHRSEAFVAAVREVQHG